MAEFVSFLPRLLIIVSTVLLEVFFKANGNPVVQQAASAFFIFGDSTVDSGNNNHVNTNPGFQANYHPYGQNGFFDEPTGRFSDGRVIVDFLAKYAGLPVIPAFRQPSAEFVQGVNFASGGAGVLPETNQGLVIDLQQQLKNFDQVQSKLTEKLGEAQAKELISRAVYFFSIGSNDYMGGYIGNPKMREMHAAEVFVGMVIGNLTSAIQTLYAKGGRKFGFLSLSPLGCLPAFRALNPVNPEAGGCFEDVSALALAHNHALSSVLTGLDRVLPGFKFSNSDFYEWLGKRITRPTEYGFEDGVNACCGTGPYGGVFTCGGEKTPTEYELCDNPKDRVWWDSFHPTEKIHEQFAQELWNGPSVGPHNLEKLFFETENLTIADIVD
ncbi:hypothetical protein H6P81_002134 [Aristolochia fimbriata]|uniref:GDSL esterase/lipase 5 n=1 Tax=Aristolochia fimbriata TaxID=158543 RepID=A0AAV7FA42_ARIFI|nr:hypothetical protein H6P81_002134 [Aristolochia fimbriata]